MPTTRHSQNRKGKDMAQLIDSNFVSERAHMGNARNLAAASLWSDQTARGRVPRLNRAASLTLIVLSSISLWAAIWALFASFVSRGL
jgi:hypothetical protein